MKKLLFVLVLISVFIAGTAFAQQSNSYQKAMKYGIFSILGIQADHVYHCAKNPSTGVTKCLAYWGGESGGSYVPYTAGYGDYSDSLCTSQRVGCILAYAVQGVCHQETNRGLYTAGKTIAKGGVGGYWLTGPTFGTYGGGWNVCKTACALWW